MRFGHIGRATHLAFSMTRRAGTALAVMALAALLNAAAQAQPKDGLDGEAAAPAGLESRIADTAAGTEGDDVYDAILREEARLRADIAGIEKLMRRQADLTRMAQTDRAEALRQRLPMSDCRASALAPLCDELTGLFRPEGEGGDGIAPGPFTGGEGVR